MTKKLRTNISHNSQKFVDQPVYAVPKKELTSIIARSISKAINHDVDRTQKPVIVGHERVELRWMEPDGKGGLKPKYPNKDQ